jgi:putative ABC transport system permease protein
VIVVLGVISGTAIGVWLGKLLSSLYMKIYHFPYLMFSLPSKIVIEAAAVSFLSAEAGTFFAVWRTATLQPAQGMRPEPPDRYHETWMEQLGLKRWLLQSTRMIIRHIQRHALKSLLTLLGIAIACGIILTGLFQRDTVSYMVNIQSGMAQREDLSVTFTDPTSYRARFDLLSLAGVQLVEVFQEVPVRLRHGQYHYRTGIRGVEPDGDIQRLIDADLRPVTLPSDGILLTDFLAKQLNLHVGDRVVVEVLEGNRPVRETTVARVVREYVGVSGYMDLAALNRFMHEDPTLSGAYLSVDSLQLQTLYTRLKEMPRIAGVAERVQEIRNFNIVMQKTMLFFTYVATVFAVIIAFGVIYNSAQIALTEREHELTSLRVLGFTRA